MVSYSPQEQARDLLEHGLEKAGAVLREGDVVHQVTILVEHTEGEQQGRFAKLALYANGSWIIAAADKPGWLP